MDQFQQLIWDLGEILGLPLHVDEHHACKLLIEERLPIQIEIDPEKESLVVGSIITELPPGKFRENVLKEALKINATYYPLGCFAYVEKMNALFLFQYLYCPQLTGEKLADFLELFVKEAESWRTAISSGSTAPSQHIKIVKQPPTPLMPPPRK